MLFVVCQHRGIGGGKLRLTAFGREPQGFTDQVKIVAKVANAIIGNVLQFLVDAGFVADVVDQGTHRQHGVGVELFAADVVGDVVTGVSDHGVGLNIMVERFGGLPGDGDEVL